MNADSFATALRAFVRRMPFRPFLIEFCSGDRLLVPHPEAIHQVESLLHFISPQKQHRLFDASTVAQLLDTA